MAAYLESLPKVSRCIFLLIALLALSSLASAPAQTRGEPVVQDLEIDIWPEYDQPHVLVIYQITLSAETPLPAVLSFRIPNTVKEDLDITARDADGSFYKVAYTEMLDIDWKRVSFTTFSPDVRLEYYNNALERSGARRTFEFLWRGDYPVAELVVQVQEPSGAENMVIEPDLGKGKPGDGGLLIHSASFGHTESEQPLHLYLTYLRYTDDLSVENLEVKPSGPLSTATLGRVSLSDVLPGILGILALLFLSGFAWWYWQSRFYRHPERYIPFIRKGPRWRRSDYKREIVICHACGHVAQLGDVYCSGCGIRLPQQS
jgi:hypothetical protein